MLTGASAGGIGTFMWSNYVRKMLVNPKALYTIADSGIFANVSSPSGLYNFDIAMRNIFRVANIDEKSPIEWCNNKYRGE